jgi:hypothetical protein
LIVEIHPRLFPSFEEIFLNHYCFTGIRSSIWRTILTPKNRFHLLSGKIGFFKPVADHGFDDRKNFTMFSLPMDNPDRRLAMVKSIIQSGCQLIQGLLTIITV